MMSLLLLAADDDSRDSFKSGTGVATAAFWLGFVSFCVSSAFFLYVALSTKSNKVRNFAITNVSITAIAATAYFAMSNGQGYIVDPVSGRNNYYARYVDWFFTTPLILLDIANLCGASQNLTALLVIMDILMIVTGLFGTLSATTGLRWAWFILGNIAFAPVLYLILVDFQRFKKAKVEIARAYDVQVWFLAVLWVMYPIVWAASIGLEAISSDAETVLTAILDILAKAVFGSMLLTVFKDALPFSEGLIADSSTDLPRHAEYDEPASGDGMRAPLVG